MRSPSRTLLLLAVSVSLLTASVIALAGGSTMSTGGAGYVAGVWNNFDFSRPPADWTAAARAFGEDDAVVDLVVAMAGDDGRTYLAFPSDCSQVSCSPNSTDLVEPFLDEFDAAGLHAILSLQPQDAAVAPLIDEVLARYGGHASVVGINIDLEWKRTGEPLHANNEERDAWLEVIRRHNPRYQLFLTYFGDSTHFPDDAPGLVVLYDGENSAQSNLLNQYGELASNFSSVGIYTGYASSVPPTASNERILGAAPNTRYILHTDDAFPASQATGPVVIFMMDNIQVDWLEEVSVDLLDLHEKQSMPVVCGVIPNGLDRSDTGGGYLPGLLRDLATTRYDLYEVAQLGYTLNASEHMAGQHLERQTALIRQGRETMVSIGITPETFVPPFGSADATTVTAAANEGFSRLIIPNATVSSGSPLVLGTVIPLTATSGGAAVLKTPAQVMDEIDRAGADAVVLAYPIFDFEPGAGNTREELGVLMDVLKSSKKYRFMTARDYAASLADGVIPATTGAPTTPAGRSGSAVPMGAVSALGASLLALARRAGRRRRQAPRH